MDGKNSKNCPLSLNGNCKYEQELVSNSQKKPIVFYAFEAVNDTNDNYFKQQLVKNTLESKVKDLGFEFKSFDKSTSNGLDWFCTKICYEIQNASLVIADISCYQNTQSKYTVNPNVAFELGIAYGFRTNYLLVSSTDEKIIPSDFRNLEILFYEKDFKNGKLDDYLNKYLKLENTSSGFEIISGANSWGNKILQAEHFDSDWLLAAEYHSTLFKSRKHIEKYLQHQETIFQKKNTSIISRWEKFREVLSREDNNRYYHIFELDGVRNYFSTGFSRLNNTKDSIKVENEFLIEEIDQTIELLKKYHPRFMVTFYEGKLPYSFFVRPNNCVIIDSKSEFPDSLNGLTATIKSIVDNMEDVFWKHWHEIPNERKQLEFVINQYENFKNLIN